MGRQRNIAVLAALTAAAFALFALPAGAQAGRNLIASFVDQAITWARWVVVVLIVWRIVKIWYKEDNKEFKPKKIAGILLAGAVVLYFLSWDGLKTLVNVGGQAEGGIEDAVEVRDVAGADEVFTKKADDT